jgi:predicted ester cyclase
MKRNLELVRQMTEAINRRDFDALDAIVASDVRRHSAATPDVDVRNLEEFKAFLRRDLAAVHDSKQEIEIIFGERDKVAVRAMFRGTQSGPMGPFPPSGREVAVPFLAILRIEKDKVAEIWVEWDNLSMLVQLGHLQPPEVPAGGP